MVVIEVHTKSFIRTDGLWSLDDFRIGIFWFETGRDVGIGSFCEIGEGPMLQSLYELEGPRVGSG